MSKLRLDYFLGLGLKLVDSDKYDLDGDDYTVGDNVNLSAANENDLTCARCFITSFAPRKNTGEQPCGGVPVVVTLNGGEVRTGITGVAFSFSLNDNLIGKLFRVATWKPDLEAIIKMQDVHDKELATPKPKRTKTEVDARPSPFPYVSAVDFDLINEYGCELPILSNKLTIYKVSGIGVLRFGDIVTEDTICLVSDYHGCIVDMMEHGGAELFEMYQKADKTELEPAKPRTKVEYVKIDISEAGDYHVNELVFMWGESCIVPLSDVDAGTFIINQHKLYRKVEREVTWQNELSEYARKESIQLAMPFSEKAQFFNMGNVEESKFIAMCHLVASMTDNK